MSPNEAYNQDWFDFEIVDAQDAASLEVGAEIIEGNLVDPQEFEAEIHAEVAEQAQAHADAAIEVGDYAAAAEYREIAENEADLAGSDAMLHGSHAVELEAAHDQQVIADEYERQEAEHAQEGDYAAAREDAANAETAQQSADSLAGGSDHSGQAALEVDQMDWATWHESNANELASDAIDAAAEGNLDHAEWLGEQAVEQQSMADMHGDLGEHGGAMSLDDPFSETANDYGFDSGQVGGDYTGGDSFSTDYSSGWDTSSGYDATDMGDSYSEY